MIHEYTGGFISEGDALTRLQAFPTASVQCVITSPPYYGLRNYGTEPFIWDGDEDCKHIWGNLLPFAKQDNRTLEQKIEQGASVGNNRKFNDSTTTATSGCFCQECGAWKGELGLEPTVQLYIEHLTQIFAEVKRVLKDDGVCFVNLGDSYNTASGGALDIALGRRENLSKQAVQTRFTNPVKINQNMPRKSLMQIPSRFGIRMTDDLGFVLRNNINWLKPACIPSSAKDRFTIDFEPIFFFTKKPKYKFNQILEPLAESSKQRIKNSFETNDTKFEKDTPLTAVGNLRNGSNSTSNGLRNKRTTWSVPFEPSKNNHFAAYPTALVEIMVRCGTDEGDIVLDPFAGTGTTLYVARCMGRGSVGIELNPEYVKIALERVSNGKL